MFRLKKGIFFTLSAMILTAVILLSFNIHSYYSLQDKMEVVEKRILTMNHFVRDVQDDLNKGVYISSFRSLFSMIQHVTSNGTYIDDVNMRFNELFFNGTYDGEDAIFMENSTFPDWVSRIQMHSDRIDINTDFNVSSVRIIQENPWYVTIEADMQLSFEDKKQTSSWKFERIVKTNITIIGLEDPIYVINSQGKLTNTITVTPYDYFTSGSDISNLLDLMNSSYYIHTNLSPSYLMRLAGNLSNSTNGIESLVNVDLFVSQGFSGKGRSIVDYIYFGNQTTTDYHINNTPAWFKIDEDHLTIYEVEDKID